MTHLVAKPFKVERKNKIYYVHLSAKMLSVSVFDKYYVSIYEVASLYEDEKLIVRTEFDGLFNMHYKKLNFFVDIKKPIFIEIMSILDEIVETPRDFYKL